MAEEPERDSRPRDAADEDEAPPRTRPRRKRPESGPGEDGDGPAKRPSRERRDEQSADGKPEREERRERPRRPRRRPSPARIVRTAREQVEALTGRRVTGVIGFDSTDDGWEVRVEVLELRRVPDTMSILGLVLVELDEDGELVGYRRLRRYAVSQVDEG
jgi:Gas vesicle synthesis protein GvpO